MTILIAQTVFWFCLGTIAWIYAGYPLAMRLLALVASRPEPAEPSDWPPLSLVIACYNEEAVLEAKLANSVSLDYPADRLQIIVASDASTDRTDAIARDWAPRGIALLRVEGRLGKTSVQNAAVRACTGEIVVFSDGNAMYDADALKRLARRFGDPGVGCVEGRRVDYSPTASAVAVHELTYRDYESWIKLQESRVASCTGATGPIYAVRRDRYVELPAHMISDLMEPILVRQRHGLRQVFEPTAVSREEVLGKAPSEFSRKVRIITRCLNSLLEVPGLLNPLRTGGFALQIWSHRLLRWLVPVLGLLLVLSALPLRDLALPRAVLAGGLLFLLAALAGWGLDRLGRGPALLRLPWYFFFANAAALLAWINWLRGRNIQTWSPDRS